MKTKLWIYIVFLLLITSSCTKKDSGELVLNHVLISNLKGLDPIRASDETSSTVGSQIFEGLLQYHYLKRPAELIPALAESLPQISKNGLVYTFKIKKGVFFQDDSSFKDGSGRELVAEDFIYSWKRLSDPRNASEGFWVFDGKIKGLNEWRKAVQSDPSKFDSPIEGLSANDSHTLTIELTEPYHQLNYVLAMTYTAAVPREVVDKYGDEFLNHPVGTGPFLFKEWVRNNKIVLEKNPNFREELYPSEGSGDDEAKGLLKDAGKKLPLVDKLVFHEVTEDQPRWLGFLKGEYDYAGIPKDSFDSAIDATTRDLKSDVKKKGIYLLTGNEPDVTYIAINMEDPVLGKHKYLRQAMNMVSDIDTLIEKFYNNRAIPAQSPIAPGTDSYDADYKNPYLLNNVEKAKELMKKAGFPDGKGLPEFTYETTNSTTGRQMAEFFQQEMSRIGIKIRVQVNTWPEMTDKVKRKKAQLWGIAWVGDYPDAQNFLQLFYGPNATPGANASNYKNKEFDKIYEQALKLPIGPKRTELYKKLRDIVVEDSPWLFRTHRTAYRLNHGWVKNIKMEFSGNNPQKYYGVDIQKRAELKKNL